VQQHRANTICLVRDYFGPTRVQLSRELRFVFTTIDIR
jgi:hypothetical protein